MSEEMRLVVDVASGQERYVPFTDEELAQRERDQGPQPSNQGTFSPEDRERLRERLRDALALVEEIDPGWPEPEALVALPRGKQRSEAQ